MNEKVVLIGAGSSMFTRGLLADMIRQRWQGTVALVDIDPAALRVVEGVARKMLTAAAAPLTLVASTDRHAVLPDATVVICTIGVGGRRAWEQDVFIPRKYGIYQPVGDTVMPGGTSRALRMIPAMVEIARDVLRLCPTALFFNYGNPMSAVCRGIRKATGAPVTGLCHGVLEVAKYLAHGLQVAPEELRYTAAGINHLTWFTQLQAGRTDLMPRLMALARQQAAHPPEEHPFTWQMTDLFGAFPAVLDRHITEFFPALFAGKGSYFGKTPGVEAFSFEKTIAYGDRLHAEMAALAESPDALPADYFEKIGGEHEQVIEIIESIRSGGDRLYSANLPNAGQVPNLPPDAVVESPAVAGVFGLRPVLLPPLAPALAGTLASRFEWVETVVEAALEGSRTKFAQALLIDGAVTSVDMAWRLADELLAAQKEYLPAFRKCGVETLP
jgi:alpha-galactosidase